MFFVTSQVGDKTILMGKSNLRLSESTPQQDTEPQRLSLDEGRYKVHVSWQVVYTLLLDTKPSLSPQTTPYFSTHVFCSVLELFLFSQYACLTLGSYQLYWIHETLIHEKTTTSKSICIILMQSGSIFKHFALEVYKLARMDG